MNRNSESRFAQVPSIDIGRSRFDRSHSVKFTMNAGELIPFLVEPVLPGDTWELETSKLVRLQTLMHPLMDTLYLDCYFFFVPNRLCWVHWKEFCGENTASAWIPSVTYTIPKIQIYNNSSPASNLCSVPDYMGIPFGAQVVTGNHEFNALPFRAYMLIWQEFFRDENLDAPLNIPTGDATVPASNMFPTRGSTWYAPYKVSKYHDYFTSCLPGVQKGPSTTFNLGVSAPLSPGLLDVMTADHVHYPGNNAMSFVNSGVNEQYRKNFYLGVDGTTHTSGYAYNANFDRIDFSGSQLAAQYNPTGPSGVGNQTLLAPNNLVVDLSSVVADLSQANSISVNDLRMAFAVQRFYEALARGGSRYTEILQNLFKVRSPDARLQRPEYLGGNRIPLSIHQVVNQAESSSSDLGNLGAYSISSDRHKDFIYSSTEHGWILGVCCIRHQPLYAQGVERFWFDTDKFDLYWPQMANLGEQPVYNGELYYQGSSADLQAFGFQEAWASYRYKPNRVAGEMRPGVPNSLASWNLADYYTSQPYLSSAWIKEDIAPLDRALAVSSSVANQALCDFFINARVVRPMPLYSVPGLIDHH